ncbi:predicted acyltransferase [Photobacterium aphoticum]|uniref:Predicted acyltransferase n=1 Tax=Photobacterium aphoticum TaxID=754436 RepID=A0A090R4H9_9GAMM|nr:predicted acyltransferase [Photobacterium aphoticum]
MSKLSFHLLEPLRFPLINRFYKAYYPAGKAKKDETIWVGESNQGIQCCVRFKYIEDYQLLTGMLVHPEQRGQGIGQHLLQAVQDQLTQQPCYCFAFAYLEAFYQAAALSPCPMTHYPHRCKAA